MYAQTTPVLLRFSLALLPAAVLAGCGPRAEGSGGQDSERSYQERVAREHEGDTPAPSGATRDAPGDTAVTATEVTYATVGGRPVTGYLARPEGEDGAMPGIIVIHEWWGLNDNIRAMTRELAAQGYRALAVDLYGGEVATDPEGAMRLMRAVDERQARSNLRQAYDALRERGSGRIGVIGWCFGGGWSLQTALLLPDSIDATVIYYGHLVTDPAKLERLQMPILGQFGSEDGSIPLEQVERFRSVLDSLGKEAEIHVYEGAGHAFANPSGTRYVPEAAERAWDRTRAFLDRHLRS